MEDRSTPDGDPPIITENFLRQRYNIQLTTQLKIYRHLPEKGVSEPDTPAIKSMWSVAVNKQQAPRINTPKPQNPICTESISD